jgi:hypothetical protein
MHIGIAHGFEDAACGRESGPRPPSRCSGPVVTQPSSDIDSSGTSEAMRCSRGLRRRRRRPRCWPSIQARGRDTDWREGVTATADDTARSATRCRRASYARTRLEDRPHGGVSSRGLGQSHAPAALLRPLGPVSERLVPVPRSEAFAGQPRSTVCRRNPAGVPGVLPVVALSPERRSADGRGAGGWRRSGGIEGIAVRTAGLHCRRGGRP